MMNFKKIFYFSIFLFLIFFGFLNFAKAHYPDVSFQKSLHYVEYMKEAQKQKEEFLEKNNNFENNYLEVEKYFLFNFQKKKNNNIKDLDLKIVTENIKLKKENKIGFYELRILSKDNDIIDTYNFSFSKFENDFQAALKRPYSEDAQSLKIFLSDDNDKNQEIFSKDIAYLHKICESGICIDSENDEKKNCIGSNCIDKSFFQSLFFKILLLASLLFFGIFMMFIGAKKAFFSEY